MLVLKLVEKNLELNILKGILFSFSLLIAKQFIFKTETLEENKQLFVIPL
jgi:hypothetical protein